MSIPKHGIFPLTIDNQGPAMGKDFHHWACWCPDWNCVEWRKELPLVTGRKALSKTERRVMFLKCLGYQDRQIAYVFTMTRETVKSHLVRAKRKGWQYWDLRARDHWMRSGELWW